MHKYIAFLRAINVGGRRVKMEDLWAAFAGLGFSLVSTFLASGNVLFATRETDAGVLERKIEQRLHEILGYEVRTFVRTSAEIAAIIAHEAFPAADLRGLAHSVYVGFVATPPGREADRKLGAFRSALDEFEVRGREVYWLCRTRMSESAFSGAQLEKTLGVPVTLRNMTTLRKLAARMSVRPMDSG